MKFNGNFKKVLVCIVLFFTVIIGVVFFTFSKNGQQKKSVTKNLLPTNSPIIRSCPEGFIFVSGSKLYNTNNFCVMKYDAKCASIASPNVGLAPPPGDSCSGPSVTGGYGGVYKNNGKGCSCAVANDKKIVSTQSGYPITYISMSDSTNNNAKAYCKNINGHLITNNEWMTIARNVEQVPANWCDRNGTNCGFVPGTRGKILANGHNDDLNEASASAGGSGALIAGDDNQPCFGTTTDGSNNCGGKNSQKRTLALNNGNIIWDFAGNVWQWVDAQVMRKNEPESETNGAVDIGWVVRSEFAPGAIGSVLINNGQDSLNYDSFRPSDPTWNANNGVGRIYHFSDPSDTSTALFAFIRGGNWRHYYDDGAFTIHMSPPADTENIDDVGFRCVVPF